jgi:hypothetical protein
MHGAAMTRNIRRTGVRATVKGKANPLYALATGPTQERIAKADNHYTVGDDKQGTRIYHFHDATVDRLYSRLTRRAGSRAAEEQLRSEYLALQRYKHHWHHSGLEISVGSVDLNRIFAPDSPGMTGMPKTERQAHHRQQYRDARHIVVENVMCAETSLEVAGWAIGSFTSRTSARDGAESILRESARKLAKMWGIS